jgi:hypothetical protein
MVVHFLVERPAIAVVEPVEIGLGVGTEGEAGEQSGGRQLGRPEARRREAGIDLAVRHLVENLVGCGSVSRLLQVELKRAARALLDQAGELRCGVAEPRHMRAVSERCHEDDGCRLGPGA